MSDRAYIIAGTVVSFAQDNEMNFLELLNHLDANKEVVLADKSTEIITDHNRYIKTDDVWSKDIQPGKPVSHAGRGGMYWTWARNIIVEEPATP